jgi:hypothetical protein
VVLEGTHAPSGETVTFHNRFRTGRNAQIIGTWVYLGRKSLAVKAVSTAQTVHDF